MIIEVLDNVLTVNEGGVMTDDVGVNIITSSENYGKYLLNELEQQPNVNITGDNVGKLLRFWLLRQLANHLSLFYCSCGGDAG